MTLAARARLVRGAAIVLQVAAIAVVGTALYGVVWASVDGLGRGIAIDAWTILELIVMVGLIAMAVVGLRRWSRGGSPTLLYGFDALPLLFLVFAAGPGALQDPLGLALAVAFVLPALVTWAASSGGGERRREAVGR